MPPMIRLESSPAPQAAIPGPRPRPPQTWPVSALPGEVITRILEHTTRRDPRDAGQPNDSDPLETVLSASLVCAAFYMPSQRVLHRDLVLPTPARAAKLLELAQDANYATHLAQNTKSISFGRASDAAEHESEQFAVEALGRLMVPLLERVQFKNVLLTEAALTNLRGLRSLELFFVRLAPGVRLDLPNLASLSLEQSRTNDSAEDAYQQTFSPALLPSLRALRIFDYKPLGRSRPSLKADRHAARRALAPQLTEFVVDDEGAWLNPSDHAFWPLFTRLTSLGLGEPKVKDDVVGAVSSAALRGLPGALARFEFWTSGPTFAVLARNLTRALEEGLVSVATLRHLELPDDESFKDLDDVAKFVQYALRDRVKAVAEARGIRTRYNGAVSGGGVGGEAV